MIETAIRPAGKPLAAFGLIGILVLTQGCQTVKEGFTPQEHAEFTPFAQKTVEVIGVDNIQLRDDELVYLRQYVDDSFTQLDYLQSLLNQTEVFRDKVILYSVELVRVSEMYATETEMVAAYAQSIDDNLRAPVTGYLQVSEREWDAVLAEVRAQEEILGALRAVQPVVSKAGQYYDELMAEIEATVVVEVRGEFDRRIQAEYAEILEHMDRYYRYRDEILEAMNLLDDYERGINPNAIAELRAKDYPIDPELFPGDELDRRQIKRAWKELAEELSENTEFGKNFDQDLEDYLATRAELDRKETELLNGLALARIQFVTWARAHQALANGVKDPGKWMELAVNAAKLVRQAL